MLANLNLQLTVPATAAESPETGTNLCETGDQAQSLFSMLLGKRTNNSLVTSKTGGELLPEDGNLLPAAPDPDRPSVMDAEASLESESPGIHLQVEVLYPLTDKLVNAAPNVAMVSSEPVATPNTASQSGSDLLSATRRLAPSLAELQAALAAETRDPAAFESDDGLPMPMPIAATLLRGNDRQVAEPVAAVSTPLADDGMDSAETARLTPLTRAIAAVDTLQPSDTRVAGLRSVRPAATHLNATLSQFIAETPTGRSETTPDSISMPVRAPDWGEKLGERIVMLASNQLKTAEIRLTPAELGPLRVQVSIDEGATNVSFQAQHAVTREAIEQALPRLRELMSESGMSLGQADVSDQGIDRGDAEQAGTAAADASNPDATPDSANEGEASERQETVTSNGLVDTFA